MVCQNLFHPNGRRIQRFRSINLPHWNDRDKSLPMRKYRRGKSLRNLAAPISTIEINPNVIESDDSNVVMNDAYGDPSCLGWSNQGKRNRSGLVQGLENLYSEIWLLDRLTYNFSERVHNSVEEKLAKSVVVRSLGEKKSYNALLLRTQTMWRPNEETQLINLDNEYFLVQFALENDYLNVVSGVLGWAIAGALGKIMKIDYNTTEGKRGRFARLAILVDLGKLLILGVMIDGHYQGVEYEGLLTIYYACAKYSHTKESCGAALIDGTVENTNANEIIENPVEPYGPWMQVPPRKKK
ncbi:uncharacterized protein LOC120182878 [Hibiscus syriacus]|uniref:uncharacterized protein LOC120182878 n=1 Tax=Hibiscus syriacus TaxID=106335 RepID=UPI001922EB80|nr:uncharacterized protein LOC120182878 [Hibiscus syriacus]